MRIIILAVLICACQAAQDPGNCQPPQLDNGFFVPKLENYRTGDKISYGCNPGLKPDLKTWWGEITCKNGEWSHTPRCIDKAWCITTHVPNAKPDELQASRPGKYDFECDHGYWIEGGKSIAECVAGSWTLPECKRKPDFCVPPPRVNNGMITTPYRSMFENGATLEYICASGYRLARDRDRLNTCVQGTWSSNPSCVEVKCNKPYVYYARTAEGFKISYKHGETVRFICNIGYEFEGTDTARCEDGTWKLPVCKDLTTCSAPHVPNGSPEDQSKAVYRDREYVTVVCDRGYEVKNRYPYGQCVSGSWTLPVCEAQAGTPCTAPRVPNAQPAEELSWYAYPTGRTVTFICNRGFVFEGTNTARCDDGAWRLPVCKRAGGGGGGESLHPDQFGVLLPVHICGFYPLIANGDVIKQPGEKELKVQCASHYKLEGPEKVGCVQGEWTELPVCKFTGGGGGGEFRLDQFGVLLPVHICGSHPLIANGDVTVMTSGMELKVQCVKLYKLVGPKTVGCVNEEWTPLPVCKPPCKVEGERIHSSQSDEYLQEGEEKRYYCAFLKKINVKCFKGITIYGECKWSL